MRVLIVLDWFLKVVEGQAVALAEAGNDVAVLCRAHSQEFAGDEAEREEIVERLRASGVQVLELAGPRYRPGGFPPMLPLARVIRAWAPDVVHVHENYDARLWLLSRRYPRVLTLHDAVPHPGAARRRLPERAAAHLWLRGADRVVVHGDQLRDDLRAQAGVENADVVPLGITPAERPLPPPPTPAVLLFGRMEPYKGVEVLIAAMRLLWETRPEVRLIVAGRGPATAAVPDDPRIDARLRYIREAELQDLFAATTVAVLPYTQASQSDVGLRAIALGVPLVVSDVGSLAELAVDRSYVVPPSDPPALSAALRSHLDVAEDERRRVLDHAVARFSWRTVNERYAELYAAARRSA